MSWIVKRKVRETWRDAVAARLASAGPDALAGGLSAFDAAVRQGQPEADAAYAVLSERGLLWRVDAPGFSTAAVAAEVQDPQPAPAG